MLIQLFMLVFLPNSLLGEEIVGDFQECLVTSSNNMLDFDENCFANYQNRSGFIFDGHKYIYHDYYNAFIFSKHNFILESKGFECKMILKTHYYRTDFLFRKYIQNELEVVQLTKLQCLLMVKEKMCNGKFNMICQSEDDCSYIQPIVQQFPTFMGTIKKEFFECHFHSKIVLAQYHNKTMFPNALKPCYPNDEVCFLPETTVVWNKNDIRYCKMERIVEVPMLTLQTDNGITIFYSKSGEFLFKIVKKEKHCRYDFYLTTEGVYLGFYDLATREKMLQMPISKYSVNHFLDRDKNDLLMAENDYRVYKTNQIMTQLACSMFLNSIRMNLDKLDTFMTLNYLGEKKLVLYFNNGQVFLPLCSNVTKIEIDSKQSDSYCEKHFKVKYVKNLTNRRLNGYLRENNIITQYSTRLENCQNKERSLVVMDSKLKKNLFLLRRSNTRVEINPFNVHLTEFKVQKANLKDLFNHHDYLVNGSDFYEQMQMYTDNANLEKTGYEESSSSNIFDGTNVVDNDLLNQIATNIKEFFSFNFLSYLKQFLTIIFILIAVFLVLYFFHFILKNIHIFSSILTKKNVQQQNIEMDQFFNVWIFLVLFQCILFFLFLADLSINF